MVRALTRHTGAGPNLNKPRLQQIVARTLLTFLGLEVAVGGDWLRPMQTEYWRVLSIPLIGVALWKPTRSDLEARPDTDPPTLIAGAVVVGFLARGAVDLIRVVLA